MMWKAGAILTATRPGRHVANRGKRGEIFIIIGPRPRAALRLACSCRSSGTLKCDCSLLHARDGVGNRKTRSDDHVDEERCRGAGIADCNLDSSGLDSSHDRRTDNSHSA
jgi:hypothetical protein